MAVMRQMDEAPGLCRRLRQKTAVPGIKRPIQKTRVPHADSPQVKSAAAQKPKGRTGPRAKPQRHCDLRCGRFVIKDRHPEYTVIQDALSQEDLQRLDTFLKRQKPEPAKMKNEGGAEDDQERKVDYNDRDCEVFWFHMQEDCPWLQEKFAEILRDVGNAFWPLLKVNKSTGKVTCEWEQTQYTVYGPGQHFYCWHQDAYADGHDQEDARQLTIVMMLTSKAEYTDGAFEMKLPAPSGKKGKFLKKSIRLDAGDIIIFPSKKLIHRVRPVKKGLRRTLVFWANDRMSCHFYNKRLAKRKAKSQQKI